MAEKVVAIGAANVDIHGFTEKALVMRDSNPGRIETCLGGVSRNISENLVKLGVATTLITVTGSDGFGRQIREECGQIGIDLQHSLVMPGMNSSTYMAIMDEAGDMALALSDMTILDQLTVNHLETKIGMLAAAPLLVMDAGLTTAVMTWLVNTFPGKKMVLDPVSIGKCRRMNSLTGQFHTIKMNRLEAGFLSGITITDHRDLETAADRLLAMGVQKLFITLGAEGVYYAQAGERGRVKAPALEPVNATGAGDAFTAAVVAGQLQEWDMRRTARFAVGAASVALMSRHTVSEAMNRESVIEWVKQIGE